MVEDLTPLCITANQVDAKVGKDGEEDEDEELSHEMILSENPEILREASPSSCVHAKVVITYAQAAVLGGACRVNSAPRTD